MYGKVKLRLKNNPTMSKLLGPSFGGDKLYTIDAPIYVTLKKDISSYHKATLVYSLSRDKLAFAGVLLSDTGEVITKDELLNFGMFKSHVSFDDGRNILTSHDIYTLVMKPEHELNSYYKSPAGERYGDVYYYEAIFAESFEEFDIPITRLEYNVKNGLSGVTII